MGFSQSFYGKAGSIPPAAGVGLRAQHYQEILTTLPEIPWFEAHSENYFAEGGQPIYYLEQVRGHYPISFHGVGLSLGSTDPLNIEHLRKLKELTQRFEPGLVSEHLSWGSVSGRYLNDLLPLPYTEEALDHVSRRISQAQDYLGRQILIENVSSYLKFRHATLHEWEFLAEVASRSGCGILLDVNNVYVNAVNHGFDPLQYLDSIPVEPVKEIHLAGYATDGDLLIDTHSRPVYKAVWDLYQHALGRFGPMPTLVEWDSDIPELHVLLEEAEKAKYILEKCGHELTA